MTPDTKSEVSGGRQDLTVAARTGPGPSSAGKVGPGTPTPTPVPAAPAPLGGVGVVWGKQSLPNRELIKQINVCRRLSPRLAEISICYLYKL